MGGYSAMLSDQQIENRAFQWQRESINDSIELSCAREKMDGSNMSEVMRRLLEGANSLHS